MAKIIWSPQSLQDIAAIGNYIALDSPRYASIVVENIFTSAENISLFPESGRKVPEFNQINVREIFYKNYRVIYEIRRNQIEILTVFHSSRLLRRK